MLTTSVPSVGDQVERMIRSAAGEEARRQATAAAKSVDWPGEARGALDRHLANGGGDALLSWVEGILKDRVDLKALILRAAEGFDWAKYIDLTVGPDARARVHAAIQEVDWDDLLKTELKARLEELVRSTVWGMLQSKPFRDAYTEMFTKTALRVREEVFPRRWWKRMRGWWRSRDA